MKKFTTIAIDGGAGSGKSTTATNLSTKLNFLHVDTGSHYRSIASVLINESSLPVWPLTDVFSSALRNK